MSIWSFPDRGPWGDSNWRGNCSGHVYAELFRALKPRLFVDPTMGSGTSIAVAREMQIEAIGLDLHAGFNALRDSILERVGRPADLCISHPPYHDVVIYSGPGGQWGEEAHPDDLSHCIDVEDFADKMQLLLFNQRDATKPGGYYGTLIGDMRRAGQYYSFQAEVIARMGEELASVIIKAQHNTVSGRKTYGRMVLPRIEHEYLLIFKRAEGPLLHLLKNVAHRAHKRLTGTWKNVVKQSLISLGGKADLQEIYRMVESNTEKTSCNSHWKDKIRQVLNQTPDLFKSSERGVWALA